MNIDILARFLPYHCSFISNYIRHFSQYCSSSLRQFLDVGEICGNLGLCKVSLCSTCMHKGMKVDSSDIRLRCHCVCYFCISLDMHDPQYHILLHTYYISCRGCKIDDRDKNGYTPFHLAALQGCYGYSYTGRQVD